MARKHRAKSRCKQKGEEAHELSPEDGQYLEVREVRNSNSDCEGAPGKLGGKPFSYTSKEAEKVYQGGRSDHLC